MKISKIVLRVNIHEWDDKDLIIKKIEELLKDIEKKKIKYKIYVDKGLISDKLYVHEISLEKKDIIEKILHNLINMGLNIEEMLRNVNFDENYNIYIRIDKIDLLIKNKVTVKYGNDVFHMKISIDGFKKDRDKVLEFLKEYLSQIANKYNKDLR